MFKKIDYKNRRFLICEPLFDMGCKHVMTLKPQAMGFFRNQDQSDLENNYHFVKDYLDTTSPLFFMHQTHSTNIVDINEMKLEEQDLGYYAIDCDGLLTNQTNQLLVSTYADCIPILIYDAKKKIMVNCHSGWKGTLNGILDKALNMLIKEYGSYPDDIKILFGPHLLWDDFEVKEDVLSLFQNKFSEIKNLVKTIDNKTYIDLNKINLSYCQRYQIPHDNLYFAEISTLLDEDCHSYRKDKEQFQQMALCSIMID